MNHAPFLGSTRIAIDIPGSGSSGNEHLAGRRTGSTQRLVAGANRNWPPGHLIADQLIAIERLARRCLLGLNLREVNLKFLGNQHRAGGKGPLTHLDLANDDGHATVSIDAYESVRCEALRRGGLTHSCERRETESQEQSATKSRTCAQEASPREALRACLLGRAAARGLQRHVNLLGPQTLRKVAQLA